MARYRTCTTEFKRRLAEEHVSGGAALSELARRHDISRELLRLWVRKHEAGEFASGGPPGADRRAYEAKIAGLERKVGQLTMELDLLKKGLASARRARGGTSSVVSGPKLAVSGLALRPYTSNKIGEINIQLQYQNTNGTFTVLGHNTAHPEIRNHRLKGTLRAGWRRRG
jgi:transposase